MASGTLAHVTQSNPSAVKMGDNVSLIDSSSSTNRILGFATSALDAHMDCRVSRPETAFCARKTPLARTNDGASDESEPRRQVAGPLSPGMQEIYQPLGVSRVGGAEFDSL